MFLPLFAVLAIAFLFYEMYWKGRKLPKGPIRWPLIGNVLPIMMNPPGYVAYQRWKDQFGSIYTYWLGNISIVTVNDYKTMQEMFVQDGENYADRGKFGDFGDLFRDGEHGIAETSGPLWREQRRFALHTLRDFGLGKARMQERILHEAECLMSMLEDESKSGPADIISHLDRTVGSVINIVVFGYRFDETNTDEFTTFRAKIDEQTRQLRHPLTIAAMTVPILQRIPYINRGFKAVSLFGEIVFEFIRKNIEAHKKVIDYDNDDAEDFTEVYLKEMHRQRDDPNTTFTSKQLENVVMDLWIAGFDTTAATMAWGTFRLIHSAQVIAKMQQEFDRVIGSERLITVQDKPKLHYTNAVITEIQRWYNLIPQNLLRKSTNEVTVNGVTIPAGTAVAPQISMLLYDPIVFPNPTEFDPDRFLDKEGNFIQNKLVLPFSVGRRACPGEGLARMELFLFFANLVHRFEISPDPSVPLPPVKRAFDTTARPPPFKCVLKRRNVQSPH